MTLSGNKYSVHSYDKRDESVEDFIAGNGRVFHSWYFLNAVGSDYTCFVITEKENPNKILGVMPVVRSSKYKVSSYNLPPFTYLYGPVVPEQEDRERIFKLLLDKLGSAARIEMKFPGEDLKVFSASEFKVLKHVSHIVSRDDQYGRDSLNKTKRTDLDRLLKMKDRGEIQVLEGQEAVDAVIGLWETTSQRVGVRPQTEKLKTIVSSGIDLYANLISLDTGEALAGSLCPYDKNAMYHLVNGSVRDVRPGYSNANILSLYLSIQAANSRGLDFDFEGSELKGVAGFYRAMGGKAIDVYAGVKTNSVYYRAMDYILNLKN